MEERGGQGDAIRLTAIRGESLGKAEGLLLEISGADFRQRSYLGDRPARRSSFTKPQNLSGLPERLANFWHHGINPLRRCDQGLV